MINYPVFFLTDILPDELSPVIVGGEASEASNNTSAVSETTTETSAPPTTENDEISSPNLITSSLFMLIAWGAIIYFLIFRPQRKQTKQLKTMQENIRPGDNIVTKSGLYGTITDIGEDVYVVEFGMNRGIKIPILFPNRRSQG